MTYSVDFRNKVVAFVRDGGGQAQAARQFDISLWCVRDWLARKDLRPQQKGVPRQRKLDKAALLRRARRLPISSNLMKFIANDYKFGKGYSIANGELICRVCDKPLPIFQHKHRQGLVRAGQTQGFAERPRCAGQGF